MNTRLLFVLLCLGGSAALADSPALHHGRGHGVVLRLDPGWMSWALDQGRLESQLGAEGLRVKPLLVDETPSTFGMAVQFGYQLFGHATIGLELGGSGWDVDRDARGGAAFLAGTLAWHPMGLIEALRDEGGPLGDRAWDASVWFGYGYGLVGEQRAIDGRQWQLGARAEYFVGRTFSVGVSVRRYGLEFNRYAIHWDREKFVSLPEGSGGAAYLPSLTMGFYFPVAPAR